MPEIPLKSDLNYVTEYVIYMYVCMFVLLVRVRIMRMAYAIKRANVFYVFTSHLLKLCKKHEKMHTNTKRQYMCI